MAKHGKRPHRAQGTSGSGRRTLPEKQRRAADQAGAQADGLSPAQDAAVASLLAQVAHLAESLRAAAPVGREAVRAALAPVTTADEAAQRAFAQRLGDVRGPEARAAVEVANALGELSPLRDVAREARRARIRLRSTGALPTLTLNLAHARPEATRAPGAEREATALAPQLVEGHATRKREEGELTLALAWQEGSDPNIVRGCTIDLDFWQDGVESFWLSAPMTRQRFLEETVGAWRAEDQTESVSVSWAQARRLVLEALQVNGWRGTEPDPEYRRHHALIEARLLEIPDTEAARAAVNEEEERAAREGDRPYFADDLEPDEVVANWLGTWSFGDYGAAYDLLANDHPIRRELSREQYITVRRQWADEAQPASLRLTLVREQAQRASALWVPGAAGSVTPAGRPELEAFWSLTVHESPLGGAVAELPLATITSQETGRHWFWTGYTLERDRHTGAWRILRTRDEGANSQALTLEELQKRIQEAHAVMDRIAGAAPPDEASARAALRELTGAVSAALHYRDALITRIPLDEAAYREGVREAQAIGNYERAAALLERMRGRFPGQARLDFELGVQYYLMAIALARSGSVEAEHSWLDRAAHAFKQAVAGERSAEYLEALAEVLARQGYFTQAVERLREALALDPARATAHSALADDLMGEVSGENLDEPAPATPLSEDARRQRVETAARAALAELREAVRLDPSLHGLYARMGALYDVLHQHEDALLAFQEAVRQDPGDAEARFTLGTLYLSRREPEHALPELEQAVQLAPLTPAIRINLAAAYLALERWREAEQELDLVDELRPGMPQVAELRTQLARLKRK